MRAAMMADFMLEIDSEINCEMKAMVETKTVADVQNLCAYNGGEKSY